MTPNEMVGIGEDAIKLVMLGLAEFILEGIKLDRVQTSPIYWFRPPKDAVPRIRLRVKASGPPRTRGSFGVRSQGAISGGEEPRGMLACCLVR